MRRGRLLSPDEVRYGQSVLVVPCGAGVVRGVGRGCYPVEGEIRQVDDTIHGAQRRGSLLLFVPEPDEVPAPSEE